MAKSAAAAIAVSGGNVYVAGSASPNTGYGSAVLWVNGTPTMLPPPGGMTNLGVTAVAVSGGNVYVVGTALSSQNWAAYWVNGQAKLLSIPGGQTIDAYSDGIAVSDGNVYVSGYTDFGSGSGGAAVFWANGGGTTLPLPSGWMLEEYRASGITVSGSNVYVVGSGVNNVGSITATYWMNGMPTTLPMPATMPDSSATSYASGITISGSDVYSVGYAEDSAFGVGKTAVYWVNDGEGTLLPLPTGAHESWANAIAVSAQ
jgi:hypothetical protein